ncbi:MAG TPA: C4-type zinc ribbon domain-containing protein [Anaerolineales bacterium]|jgi:predicted  nucleic acid-binding Zn-ribbon protein|nr:C4-type zinc ribbon domain-containing protein [Anaerolineales bacterium]HQX16408.1 C4-type zinc ribbon domain-containing protein [Anaerolineales bacterium]
MSAALGLYRLQQVDSQMDQIHGRLKAIQETLQNDGELRAAMEAFSVSENEFKTAERAFKSTGADVEKQRIKIEQAESSLYGGKVSNPKELQDLQLDVASLKKHLVTLENIELEAMGALENAEQATQTAKSQLERVQADKSIQYNDLTKEGNALQKEIERLDSERKAVISGIPQPSVLTYDSLRKQKRGVAIATVSDSACAACGTTLTASQQQSARSTSQLFTCPTCGRILFAN